MAGKGEVTAVVAMGRDLLPVAGEHRDEGVMSLVVGGPKLAWRWRSASGDGDCGRRALAVKTLLTRE